jgi:phosphoribosylanthranilate isomerase
MTSQLKIKVCGMRNPDNIQQLIGLGPDFIGFILFPGSKRYLGNNYVLEADVPGMIQKVGVFVNSVISDVVHWKSRLDLDIVQLHGTEPPEYCKEIHGVGLKIIKSFGIDHNFEFSILDAYAPFCDYFLFDAITPLHGGSGLKYDWSVLQKYSLDIPFFLSGGIGPDDASVLSKLNVNKLLAIDINSRFEISPGLKDIDLIKNFLAKLRS